MGSIQFGRMGAERTTPSRISITRMETSHVSERKLDVGSYVMERAIQQLKDRTESFDDLFPCKSSMV